MQDMIYSVGSWDQVREGGNTIKVAHENEPVKVLYLATGRYTSKQELIKYINMRFETLYNDGNYLAFKVRPAVVAEPVRYWRHTGAAKYESKQCTPYIVGDYTSGPIQAKPEYLELRNLEAQPNTTGWGRVNKLKITFCPELALLLGIIQHLDSTPPKPILAGWKIEYSQVDVFRNNLRLVWVFADFVKKTDRW